MTSNQEKGSNKSKAAKEDGPRRVAAGKAVLADSAKRREASRQADKNPRDR